MIYKSIYPFTQETIAEYLVMTDKEIANCLQLAETAFGHWRNTTFEQRATVFMQVAVILKRDKDMLATLIVHEMGKIKVEAIGEIEKCAYVCEYYAEHAVDFLQDEMMEAGYHKSFVTYQPIGAVLGIMPWNFPFWQVFRYVAPTLMAGNVTLLKHAPNVCGCALIIEKIFIEAGAQPGVFQTLIIETSAVEKILEADIVQAVSLTGSERAGSSVAMFAGKNIKKSVLELGGSDALIVLPDADMKLAAKVALQSRFLNAGQSCIGSKRFIVLENALDDFMQEIYLLLPTYNQGDPFIATTTTGPLARLDLAENLQRQMQQSIGKGALAGFSGTMEGCNFSPALLMNVSKGMLAFDEETFGPLAAVIIAKNEAEAINFANDSALGLGGSIWTRDIDKGIALARKINTGSVFINSLVKSDPRLPIGGIKKSGYGRELGRHGILEFVNAKTIAAAQ